MTSPSVIEHKVGQAAECEYMPDEIQPDPTVRSLPGLEPSEPAQQAGKRFSVFDDSSPYPTNISKTLEHFLRTGRAVWKAPDGKYYQAIPSDYKETKQNRTFYVSVNEYAHRPGTGAKPQKTYSRAYWIDQRVGEFQNRDFVYYMVDGAKVADPALDYTPPPHSVPNNFAQFAKDDPKLFKKFYKALLLGIAVRTMRQMRKNQAKLKEAMHSGLS